MKQGRLAVAIAFAALISASGGAAKDPRPGLFLRAGEAYIFRLENGQPVEVRRAAQGEAPAEGELKAEMSQRGGTMLVVTNQTGAALDYEAYVAKDEYARGTRTSTCTAMSGPMAMEHWPQNLPGVRITNFQPAGDGIVCR